MEPTYPHLGLKSWPFQVVPDDETVRTWADRAAFKKLSYGALKSASRIPTSQVTLFWAWYGSGKSHTLRHLAWICKSGEGGIKLTPVYAVFPGQISNALDLYRSIVSSIDLTALLDGSPKDIDGWVATSVVGNWKENLASAINCMKHGGESAKGTIRAWLAADKVHLNQLRECNIDRRIENMEDAIKILSSLVRMLCAANGSNGIVLMIDEFQEIGKLPAKKLHEVNTFLHKLFDANPKRLQLFLSFTTGDKETVNHLLGEALQSRVSNTLSLPEFDQQEACEFLRDLVALHSLDGASCGCFAASGFQALVVHLQGAQKRLVPRELIIAAGKVLTAADPLIEDGELAEIDNAFVNSILNA